MRRRQKTSSGKKRRVAAVEPLAEGIVPLDSRGRRWSELGDEELIEHAKRFMKENGIRGKGKLQQVDGSLYATLGKRGVMDAVGFDKKKRQWKAMNDEELVQFAKTMLMKRGISGKTALKNADLGLYNALRERRLFRALGFKDKHRDWGAKSDGELLDFAKKIMDEKGIDGREGLRKADSGLHCVLARRGLLGSLQFVSNRRDWKSRDSYRVLRYARKVTRILGIGNITELERADFGLATELRKRNLVSSTFKQFDREIEAQGLDEISDAVEDFTEEHNI
jgi:hypothetical protein